MEPRKLLDEQVAYYRARAAEYDEWFLREGRYDRGPEHRAEWFNEVAAVETALRAARPGGDVLELACGTGLWTRHLVADATRVTAVDASPETLALNRARVRSRKVEYILADIFAWEPARAYDFVLFAFWLSHVPAEVFEPFWALVGRAVRPGGRVFFVDNLRQREWDARDNSGIERRRLNDGREFDIVKVYYEPADLVRRLAALGWPGFVRASGRFFLYGTVARRISPTSSTLTTGGSAMAKKVKPVPDGYHTATPYLIVHDAARALDFYPRAFGARELMRFAHGGKIGHAEIKLGDSRIMLADEHLEMDARSPRTIGGSPVSILLYVKDVDALVARAVGAGAKLKRPVEDKFYGDRSGTVEDPFGHTWHIATHKEDLTRKELQKRAAAAHAP